MDRKTVLLEILEQAEDYVSGSDLANQLGVTRASVWKIIKALKNDGYDITAVTNRGYRLSPASDVVTAAGVKEELGEMAGPFSIRVVPTCPSTNLLMKEQAHTLPEWQVVIAGEQTAGRGRRGRSFHSPEGTGLYLSVLLRPKLLAGDSTLITTAAAVAVCRAIEELTGLQAGIKWVNDIFVHGKKAGGILTEASFDMESGTIEHIILGVGINVTEPAGGFPDNLAGIAGALLSEPRRDMRNRLAAAFLRQLYPICQTLPEGDFIEEYQKRNFLTGKEILVLGPEGARPATALAIDGRCRLVVEYPDGSRETLSSGEISVKPS